MQIEEISENTIEKQSEEKEKEQQLQPSKEVKKQIEKEQGTTEGKKDKKQKRKKQEKRKEKQKPEKNENIETIMAEINKEIDKKFEELKKTINCESSEEVKEKIDKDKENIKDKINEAHKKVDEFKKTIESKIQNIENRIKIIENDEESKNIKTKNDEQTNVTEEIEKIKEDIQQWKDQLEDIKNQYQGIKDDVVLYGKLEIDRYADTAHKCKFFEKKDKEMDTRFDLAMISSEIQSKIQANNTALIARLQRDEDYIIDQSNEIIRLKLIASDGIKLVTYLKTAMDQAVAILGQTTVQLAIGQRNIYKMAQEQIQSFKIEGIQSIKEFIWNILQQIFQPIQAQAIQQTVMEITGSLIQKDFPQQMIESAYTNPQALLLGY